MTAAATMDAVLVALADASMDAVLMVDACTYRDLHLIGSLAEYGFVLSETAGSGRRRSWLRPSGDVSRLPREVEVVRNGDWSEGPHWTLATRSE